MSPLSNASTAHTAGDLRFQFGSLHLARSLRRRGVRNVFKRYAERIQSFVFVRDKHNIAVAFVVPSAVLIQPLIALKKKDMAYLVRAFTYSNPDPNPKHLLKCGRVTVASGGSESTVGFDVKILPVDDPLEIYVFQTNPIFRIGASETCAVPAEVATRLLRQREKYAPFAAPDLRLNEARVGACRPFMLHGIKLFDPDTEYWDRGSIQIEVASNNSRTDYVGVLSLEMQLRQYVLSHSEPTLLAVLRPVDQPCLDISSLFEDETSYLTLAHSAGLTVPSFAPSSTVAPGTGTSTRAVDVYDLRRGVHQPVHVGIATATVATRGSNMLTTIAFRKPRGKDEEQVVDCEVLTYMHNVLYIHFATHPPVPGPRLVKLTVADGQNPVPGKTQMTVHVVPEFLANKDHTTSLVVNVTRTKAPSDAHSVFSKANMGLGDNDVYNEGCIEAVFVATGHESDCFSLRLNSSHMIIKDDIIIAGKDAVGRLFLEPQYFRLQFARSGRGPTGKRIAEIVRSLFVQVMKEGERTVAMVFTEGPIAAPHDDVLLNPPPGKNVIPSTPKPGAQSADTPKALARPATVPLSSKGWRGWTSQPLAFHPPQRQPPPNRRPPSPKSPTTAASRVRWSLPLRVFEKRNRNRPVE
jgi:hypothetical protein